jgi:heme/copper-type cytochrome/quinol oxidase subunit 1
MPLCAASILTLSERVELIFGILTPPFHIPSGTAAWNTAFTLQDGHAQKKRRFLAIFRPLGHAALVPPPWLVDKKAAI